MICSFSWSPRRWGCGTISGSVSDYRRWGLSPSIQPESAPSCCRNLQDRGELGSAQWRCVCLGQIPSFCRWGRDTPHSRAESITCDCISWSFPSFWTLPAQQPASGARSLSQLVGQSRPALFQVGWWWMFRGRAAFLYAFRPACTPYSKYRWPASTSSSQAGFKEHDTNGWRCTKWEHLVDLRAHRQVTSPVRNHTVWLRSSNWLVRWKAWYLDGWVQRSGDKRVPWPFDRRCTCGGAQRVCPPWWAWKGRCPYVQRLNRCLGCSQHGLLLKAW